MIPSTPPTPEVHPPTPDEVRARTDPGDICQHVDWSRFHAGIGIEHRDKPDAAAHGYLPLDRDDLRILYKLLTLPLTKGESGGAGGGVSAAGASSTLAQLTAVIHSMLDFLDARNTDLVE